MTNQRLLACTGAAVLIALACGEERHAPAAPSPSVIALRIVAPAGPFAVGGTLQLTASVRLSTGGDQDVTASSRWTSSSAEIATVSPAGLVTFVGSGDVQIMAVYARTTATATLSVRRRATLMGNVHESAPTEQISIPGARVELVDAAGSQHSTESAADGSILIADVISPVKLRVSRDGYEPFVWEGEVPSTPLDVPLLPVNEMVLTRLEGRLCPMMYSWCTAHPFQEHHTVVVHRPGTISVSTRFSGFDYSEFLTIEVRCGTQLVERKTFFCCTNFTFEAVRPCAFEASVGQYSAGKYPYTDYRVDVLHPR